MSDKALALRLDRIFRKVGIYMILHIIILLLSIFLVVDISVDTFHDVSFYTQEHLQVAQFWICLVFMLDFFIELVLAADRKRYLRSHFIFFLVSIPYQAIIYHFGWQISGEVAYMVRYMPLVRGGYAMAIVVSWFTSNKATSLFWSYAITIVSTIYCASLTFYLFENGVNPMVKSYADALYWSLMDATTLGCNIDPVTGVGRVLAVLLAIIGITMFPVFTVYASRMVKRLNSAPPNTISLYNALHPVAPQGQTPAAQTVSEGQELGKDPIASDGQSDNQH